MEGTTRTIVELLLYVASGLFLCIGCFDLDMPKRPEQQGIVADCEGGRLHIANNLCWQDPPAEVSLNWEQANNYCADLYHEGFDDWFLPDRHLYMGILEGCETTVTDGNVGYCNSCAESEICNALFGEDATSYWTSSTHDSETSWAVNTTNGYVYREYSSEVAGESLRCVREITSGSDSDADGDSDGDADRD